jgi:hypothetical protein
MAARAVARARADRCIIRARVSLTAGPLPNLAIADAGPSPQPLERGRFSADVDTGDWIRLRNSPAEHVGVDVSRNDQASWGRATARRCPRGIAHGRSMTARRGSMHIARPHASRPCCSTSPGPPRPLPRLPTDPAGSGRVGPTSPAPARRGRGGYPPPKNSTDTGGYLPPGR